MIYYKVIDNTKIITFKEDGMINIMGIQYLTVKEAAGRYGYSKEWFDKRRTSKKEPIYIKVLGKGRILYPLTETDEWFKNALWEHNDGADV